MFAAKLLYYSIETITVGNQSNHKEVSWAIYTFPWLPVVISGSSTVGLCVRETKHFIIYILHNTVSLRLINVTLLRNVGSGVEF